MQANLIAVRAMLALLLALLLPGAMAGVPNDRAKPAYAEEQTMLQVESDSRRPEPGLASSPSGRQHFDRHYLGEYGATERDVIVQRGGNTWRELRNGPAATIFGSLLVLALLGVFVLHAVVGPSRVDTPPSGRRILRFSAWDRGVHWATAISFLALAITGLLLFFGKNLLLPWMGHDLFAGLAYVSKYIHNFFGPLFIACSVVMFLTFLHRNFLRRWDWQWVKSLGGIAPRQHVPAGYFNAGEKAWFWLGLTLLGLVMSFSGLVLDFVNFGQTRYVLQMANYLHIAGATFYIAAAIGHIYMGTLGVPGAYEAMRHGSVDEEWARTHHEIWYDELKAGVAPPPSGPDTIPPRPLPGTVH
jgi:formate dehydrogenase subunit gamma